VLVLQPENDRMTPEVLYTKTFQEIGPERRNWFQFRDQLIFLLIAKHIRSGRRKQINSFDQYVKIKRHAKKGSFLLTVLLVVVFYNTSTDQNNILLLIYYKIKVSWNRLWYLIRLQVG